MDKIKNFFSSDKNKDDSDSDTSRSSRRKSILGFGSTSSKTKRSIFADVDPILCSMQNKDPTAPVKPKNQETPKVIRRGSNKFRRSRGNVGNSIAYMSPVSSVSYAGQVINYQYEFKLKYGTINNYDEDQKSRREHSLMTKKTKKKKENDKKTK